MKYDGNTCPQCGSHKLIDKFGHKRKFCSHSCWRLSIAQKTEKRNCPNCGKEFSVIISRPKCRQKQFCSKSCSSTGKFNPMYGADRTGPNAPWLGRKHTKEAKEKIRQAALSRPYPSEETRKKLATWTGKTHSEETKKKMSATRLEIWADASFREKMKTVFPQWTQIKPNGLERRIIDILPQNVRYTGNGTWWKLLPNGKRKNPDFKVTGKNKVVEVFGDYWHRGENPQELIDQYRQVGLDCLVLWESEIKKQPDMVREKIYSFIEATP